ncbi:MAG TPA: hypothetical protein VJZ71_18060 [Phycisphaerae bacterium]|nr:hypothetical protein [Phycisphaerae bacterium]
MFADSYQVLDVLMLVGNVAPIALYFLILGLVNSHSRPWIVTSRSDFLALTSVLIPVLLWPVPDFIRGQLYVPLVAGLLMAVTAFWYMLPRTHAGFVVYNVAEPRCVKLLTIALRQLGLSGHWDGRVWHADSGCLSIEVRKFSLLRNVTLHFDAQNETARDLVPLIGHTLHARLQSVAQLPSPMGAGLVLLGVGLMILPMWMVGRHIHDLVDAVSYLLG